jgi:hypothetical protein
MPAIGFVILTHSNPFQITRLIRSLNALYSSPPIALHHDFSQCPLELSLPGNVRIVQPSIVTGWGQFSVVRATLAGMSTLLSEGDKPRWFAVLSGSCYPTKQAKYVIADLEEGGYDAYLHHELIDPAAPRRMFHRVCVWRYFNWSIPYPGGNNPTGYRNIKTPKVLASQCSCYQDGFACFAGALWFTARSSVAEYILRWSEENPWLSEYLSHRPSPDETYFHSIICNGKQFRVSQKNYRYVDWSAGGPHPKTLGLEDLPFILRSGSHFARKFVPGSDVLDALDQHLALEQEKELRAGSVGFPGKDRIPEACCALADSSSSTSATGKKISVVIARSISDNLRRRDKKVRLSEFLSGSLTGR